MLTVILGLVNAGLGYLSKRADVGLETTKAGLTATVENNKTKVAANGWWGAKLIILTAGLPAALHMGAVFIDTTPFWIPLFMDGAHVVGSWGIEKLPPPYDDYQRDIVLSFFIVLPVMQVTGGIASAIAGWIAKR